MAQAQNAASAARSRLSLTTEPAVAARLVEQILTALDAQTVVVPCTAAAETLSAFAALADPASRANYDRKHAEGKKHNAALVCLTRRRVDVLQAMLCTRTSYQHKQAEKRHLVR